jgi:hypothetical protein
MKTTDKIVPRFGQPCLTVDLSLEQFGAAFSGPVPENAFGICFLGSCPNIWSVKPK